VATCGVFGASLFYGDALLTPAISVLSAVEGISVATPALEKWVVPVTVGIVIGLFSIQSRGTGAVGAVKLAEGGWFPLACGLAIFTMLTTWKRAETVVAAREGKISVPVESFPAMLGADIPRVAGTAVYLSPDSRSVPRCCCTT